MPPAPTRRSARRLPDGRPVSTMSIDKPTAHPRDCYPTRTVSTSIAAKRLDPVVYGRSTTGLIIDDARLDVYQSHGFLVVENVFDRAEVALLQEELARLGDDSDLRDAEFVIREPEKRALRSIFQVHRHSRLFDRLTRDGRLVDLAQRILGSEVYLHQTRVNYKPGHFGKEFYWHSDFETWHAEDGLPRMRTVSMSISLSANSHVNGPLMLIPGSHLTYVPCLGQTPEEHHLTSLRKQEVGVPQPAQLDELVRNGGIEAATGPAGSVVVFDCNTMHGSNSNISPYPRANVFLVYNSILNRPLAPFAASKPRPEFLAERFDFGAIAAVRGRIRDVTR
jgi:ectoine hydroxylase